MSNSDPFISIVVIGLNEESQLESTFSAIKNINYPKDKYEVIYVDSGSTDRSVEIAAKFTHNVFIENSVYPTAARGRNRGLVQAKGEIVHFIDGDVQIDRNYLKKALNILTDKKVSAVYGYLIEKSKKGINNILLSHWDRKRSGYSNSTGAGGTFVRKALLAVDGYDERIRRGEETELGQRFSSTGLMIYYMDEPMGIHDYGVKSILDLGRVYFSDGFHKSILIHSQSNTNFVRENRKSVLRNYLISLLFLSAIFCGILFGGFLGLMLVFSFITAFPFLKVVIRKKVISRHKILYFLIMEYFRGFSLIGQIKGLYYYYSNQSDLNEILKHKEKLIY